MFNRRLIHYQPDFQRRRGGTYKTYESPSPYFAGIRTIPFRYKKLFLLGRAPHLVFFHVK